ncbi:alpha/beta fold hydrolase [Dactylosporangium sp. NPDC005572]|uniref:alpha/beta hydrolase n=1 Tax=Dactylosporangium sp. NPDC005572 TaxID=3156889 RepID=UPI0033B0BF94
MEPSVAAGHDSRTLSHGGRRAHAVLLLHGYTHSPAQLDGLAAALHRQGYNVHVPRAPFHGVVTPGAHARVRTRQLLDYADAALERTARLGEEVGIVGVSGGAVLATWLAARGGGTVRRLLALAPFYAPAPGRIPPVLLRPLIRLYGLGLLPDRVDRRGYSYRAVAQYLRIAAFREVTATGLRHVAVAVSENDTVVDRALAFDIPSRLAAASGASLALDTLPARLGLGHNIVSGHDELVPRFVELYEG